MEFKNDLKDFILENNIIGTMSGVAIALYSKDLILSLSGDVILPLIFFILTTLNIKWLTKLLPHKVKFNFTDFFRNFISWLLGVLITYAFIQITVKYILGINKKSNDKSKEDNTKA
jgi:large-conductance mechanosensitive channel